MPSCCINASWSQLSQPRIILPFLNSAMVMPVTFVLIRRGKSEMVTGVGHHTGPTKYDLIAGPKRIFDFDHLVWKRTAKPIAEFFELAWTVKLRTRLVLSDSDTIFIHQLVDGPVLSFFPHFLEPTPQQRNIFFHGHVTPSFEAVGQLDAPQAWYSMKLRYEPADVEGSTTDEPSELFP